MVACSRMVPSHQNFYSDGKGSFRLIIKPHIIGKGHRLNILA